MAGRPTKFNVQLCGIIRPLYEAGLIDVEVAESIGVSVRTLHYWKAKYPAFLHSIKRAKAVADDQVEGALFMLATGYSLIETKVVYANGRFHTTDIVKNYPPNTTALIFWLKNRRPNEWRY